jgi:hypothetical protein
VKLLDFEFLFCDADIKKAKSREHQARFMLEVITP